ncbi:MAG: ABC transporter ATP-binding protein [Betaproteobacteria bacterium]|nr:ABC transporter ATP-binding protein [Betaproteobacteria bacterium]NBO43963.1 ABC transporter ATP-binding protein [Betaproteobacteria bacterium]NBP11385.1 ABC transporter ATP-binding protein [Betaproteobacteria bacterium]NBQ81425.1 ABC transporter ATP-binding protein [Betaproteobacteria bacterium]NBS21924.1 ABC transporter ATP-binding protein [Betaproteobacteria bacterium]
MPEQQTSVRIRHCAKTYPDGTVALRSTDLDIAPGEILALLGPSGCGKTTLLRIIAGLETANPGAQIFFGADEVGGLRPEVRQIGMVFQHYALFPQMDVAANIAYGLKIRGIAPEEIRKRVADLLDLVRLDGLAHKRPAELSGGQRQRVALARAIAIRPRVLLLDEPLTALDAKLKESLRDELAALLRQLHVTAIHVTHDQHEAMAIADRLAVMHHGEVIQVGSAEQLYRAPADAFVASFLGHMNRVPISFDEHARPGIRLGGLWLALEGDARVAGAQEVLIRPEDIRLYPLSNDPSPLGLGRILQRAFLGDRIQFRVLTPEGIELRVQESRDCSFVVDDSVHVDIQRDALKTFGVRQ